MAQTLVIGNENFEVEYIGEGGFAKAYKYGEKVILNVVNCGFREALAALKTPIPHLPIVEKLAEGYYLMPFYSRIDIRSEQYGDINDILDAYSSFGGSTTALLNFIENQYPQYLLAFQFIMHFIKHNNADLDLEDHNMGFDENGSIILRDPVADFAADGTSYGSYLTSI